MSAETNRPVSTERALGAELVRAAEMLLAGAHRNPPDASVALQLKTVDVLLALYWELRHSRRAEPNVIPFPGRAALRPCPWPRACDPGA